MSTTIIISAICVLLIIAGVVLLLRSNTLSHRLIEAQLGKNTADTQLAAAQERIQSLEEEKKALQLSQEALRTQQAQAMADLEAARKTIDLKESHEEEMKKEREEYNQQQLKLLEERFKTASEQLLKARSEELQNANSSNMEQLFNPLKQQLQQMNTLMNENTKSTNDNVSTLKGAIQSMYDQTTKVGQEADRLAEALKNKGKVHGDWGEMVLTDILQGSGLIEGQQFVCQECVRGEKDNLLRPDVIVNNPDGSRVIIDSKVSLTAFADALGAESEEARQAAIKANYDSVWAHVKELAKKEYPKYVDKAIQYVLMFVPNEGAYVMAMNHKPSLLQDAFRQGVVIVNPTNLMLTLFLIYQSWQNSRQSDNCRKIIEVATSIYEKAVGLETTFNDAHDKFNKLQEVFEKAEKQLDSGKGSLLSRVENLKTLGVTSPKKLTRKNASSLSSTDDAPALSTADDAPLPTADNDPTSTNNDDAPAPTSFLSAKRGS